MTGLRKFRFLNRLFAFLAGYFWLRCPACGEMLGGHEASDFHIWINKDLPGEFGLITCWKHGSAS